MSDPYPVPEYFWKHKVWVAGAITLQGIAAVVFWNVPLSTVAGNSVVIGSFVVGAVLGAILGYRAPRIKGFALGVAWRMSFVWFLLWGVAEHLWSGLSAPYFVVSAFPMVFSIHALAVAGAFVLAHKVQAVSTSATPAANSTLAVPVLGSRLAMYAKRSSRSRHCWGSSSRCQRRASASHRGSFRSSKRGKMRGGPSGRVVAFVGMDRTNEAARELCVLTDSA